MSDVEAAILGLELKETAEKAEDAERQAQHRLGEARVGLEHAAIEVKNMPKMLANRRKSRRSHFQQA